MTTWFKSWFQAGVWAGFVIAVLLVPMALWLLFDRLMGLWLAMGVLVGLFFAVGTPDPLRGTVSLTGPLTIREAIDGNLVPQMYYGFDGLQSYIYHVPSGTLILATKVLAGKGRDSPVKVGLKKLRVMAPSTFDVEKGWVLPGRFRHTTRFVRAKRLPGSEAGEVVAEVDCGPSMLAVLDTMEAMIREEPALAEDAPVYVWSQGRGMARQRVGRFQEHAG
ncbi:MAG TPA: hypothetical protein VFH53_01415 [Phycisphaerae bacterium]|nr:hypothetical protein [Phycisphaerae bacterium]